METTTDRVRELINRSGLSQREYAEAVGLDNSKMSKSLGGARRFSSLDLARIAEHSKVTVDWLLTGSEPELALAARVSAGTSTETAITEARRLAGAREDVAYLGYDQPWLPLEVLGSDPRLSEQGERLAGLAHERITTSGADLRDLAGAIESTFGADVAIGDLGPEFDGLSVSNDDVKLIMVSQRSVPWRQRFTIAHELGHLLVADDQGLHVDEDVFDRDLQRQPTETRANAFASALLMPEQALRDAVGRTGLSTEQFAKLTCELRVSPSALAIRLSRLRLIDSGTGDRLKKLSAKQAAELAGRSAELALEVAEAAKGRPPGLLARDTYQAYVDGKATIRPYANVINADVDALLDALESIDGVVPDGTGATQ